MAKIAFFEIEPWEKEYLAEKLSGHELFFSHQALSMDTIDDAKGFEIISPFIYSAINREALDGLPEAQFITTRSTGFDHIDVVATKEKGITVSNVPLYGENTVAEHAFALMLALSKKIFQSVERTRKGDFSLDGLMTFDLKEKTLGIVGMGHIGQHVARMAKAFEMKVVAYDVRQDEALAKEFGFSYVALDELFAVSDIISLHTTLNESTKHIINANNIKKIKKGAYLINTARGELVETGALVEALDTGILAGAGLDVLEQECAIKEERQLLAKQFPATCDLKTILQDHLLLNKDNVIVTPHNAFHSKEALQRILNTTIENINAFVAGKPINVIRPTD